MNISELKPKQSVKLYCEIPKPSFNEKKEIESREYSGIVLGVREYDVEIVSTKEKMIPEKHSDYLFRVNKEYIKNISRTRFPKEVSVELKNIVNEIEKARTIDDKIYQLERERRQQYDTIKEAEKRLVQVKFQKQPSLQDIAKKLKEDIQGLDNHSTSGEFMIYNPNINNKTGQLFIQASFSKTTRNVKGVTLHYDHMRNVDWNDWEGVAENYAPNFLKEVKEAFSFAKKIDSSRNAEPGEKQYVHLSNDFMIYLDVNKNNYDDMVHKIQKAAKKLSPLCSRI